MRLETDRLVLRPPVMSDAPTIHHYVSDYDVAVTMLTIPHPYQEGMAEAFIERVTAAREDGSYYALAITRKADDQLVGAITLRPNYEYQHAEMGYWVGKPHWGLGYATEAAARVIAFGFQELKLARIFASYFTDNPASRRVMEKSGMVYEGMLRQHYLRLGVFHDVGYCGILRSEWEAGRG